MVVSGWDVVSTKTDMSSVMMILWVLIFLPLYILSDRLAPHLIFSPLGLPFSMEFGFLVSVAIVWCDSFQLWPLPIPCLLEWLPIINPSGSPQRNKSHVRNSVAASSLWIPAPNMLTPEFSFLWVVTMTRACHRMSW